MKDPAGGHSAATLYEAAKLPCACDPEIRAAWPGARVAAPAYTVRGIGGDNLALHNAVLAAPAGSVLVADMQGARNGHWGEILAAAAQHRGLAGLVIDGGVRDTVEMAAMGFPVFSRSVTVVGTVKDYPGDLVAPVRIGGIVVHTGDLVVGDADGVVVLPQAVAADVVRRSDQRVADEARILEAIRNGTSTLELYCLPAEGTFAGRHAH
ncbi:RraA family protein [Arthrobacter sp. S39]|uniref:RraA family protein n=1 Tax=Arthrobacter sp. S39 TaxID=2509720 RepID=UPI0010375738|nr:RraA family protein [Arthrobacter sp. S39]TAP43345.1 RraA family protein [Arthrobacter sp. S39]